MNSFRTPLAVDLWPLDRVKPYPGNPRVNDAAVDAVAVSLKEYGFRQPIVVDAGGAVAYAEAGDFEKAVECQGRCLDLSPADRLAAMRERLVVFESRQPFRAALTVKEGKD
jgi:hypothetical protein